VTRGELRAAFLKSGIRGRDRFVYLALLDHADNKTCEIPDNFQPFGQDSEQWWGVSRRTVQRAIPHLYHHGWLSYLPWGDRPRPNPARQSRTDKRRGRPRNWYALHEGRPCDCPPKYRTVDGTTGEVIKRQPGAQVTPDKAPEPLLNKAPEVYAIKRLTSRVSAGQTPNRPEGFREGEGEGMACEREVRRFAYPGPRAFPDWEPGTIGWEMNRPARENFGRAA
jgi:hypothetical protein